MSTKILFNGKLDNVSMGTDQCFSLSAKDKNGRVLYLYGIRSEVDSDSLEVNIYAKDGSVVSKTIWEGGFDNIPALRYDNGTLDLDVEPFDYILRDGSGDEVEAGSISIDLAPFESGYSVTVKKTTEVV